MRTAFSRLLTHWPPNTSRIMAEFRLKASAAMAHYLGHDFVGSYAYSIGV